MSVIHVVCMCVKWPQDVVFFLLDNGAPRWYKGKWEIRKEVDDISQIFVPTFLLKGYRAMP